MAQRHRHLKEHRLLGVLPQRAAAAVEDLDHRSLLLCGKRACVRPGRTCSRVPGDARVGDQLRRAGLVVGGTMPALHHGHAANAAGTWALTAAAGTWALTAASYAA